MKVTVLRDIATCSLVEVDRRFRSAHHRNVGLLLRDYAFIYPRRLLFSTKDHFRKCCCLGTDVTLYLTLLNDIF
jgi:hypothetical protein